MAPQRPRRQPRRPGALRPSMAAPEAAVGGVRRACPSVLTRRHAVARVRRRDAETRGRTCQTARVRLLRLGLKSEKCQSITYRQRDVHVGYHGPDDVAVVAESSREHRRKEPWPAAGQRTRIRTCTAPYSCSAWPRLPRRWWWPTAPRHTRTPSPHLSAERVRKTPASSARLARSESGVPALCEAASTHCAPSLRWYEARNVVETSPSKKFHRCGHHREKRRWTAPTSPAPPSETATTKSRRGSNHSVRVTDVGRAAGTASNLRLPGGPRRPRGLRCLHPPAGGLRASM
jgi:hypothetical protein